MLLIWFFIYFKPTLNLSIDLSYWIKVRIYIIIEIYKHFSSKSASSRNNFCFQNWTTSVAQKKSKRRFISRLPHLRKVWRCFFLVGSFFWIHMYAAEPLHELEITICGSRSQVNAWNIYFWNVPRTMLIRTTS